MEFTEVDHATTLPPLALLVPAQRRSPAPPAAPLVAAPSRRPRRRTAALLAGLALLVPLLPASSGADPVPSTAVRAYFFGDSLMSGTGASPLRPVMAQVAATRLGWTVEVDAWGGTGYTTTGRSPDYLERLRRPGALSGEYDVVLLEGGTNDARMGSDPVAVRAAVRRVVAEVQRRQPRARIVLMGAYDPPGVIDLRRGIADDAVRDVAGELGLPFFSPWSQQWTRDQQPERFLDRDGLHPNTYGYGVMGLRLSDELAGALPDLASSSQAPQTASREPAAGGASGDAR